MTLEPATVKAQVSAARASRGRSPHVAGDGTSPAEALRLQFADAWGDMSASWGVAPAIGRVHAYLMVRGVPLTEREVREALGLSHRAASLALTDAEAWGIVERVPEPRRVGRRGPAGTAYLAVGDHWQWFTSVIAGRKVREGDPIVEVIERTTLAAGQAATANPEDRELVALHEWLTAFAGFVRLFDRAVGLIPKLEPRELERGMRLLGEISDETVLRLVHLLGGLPDDDVLELIEALSRLSPTAARRATKLMSGVVRTVAR
jgi:DNA-binding transcriptional regulator GbsR (MarR family)